MNTSHEYRIAARSTDMRSGVATAEGIEPTISFSAPPEFKGQAGHWTPEHFFVTAVASCYISTFSGLAFNSNLEFHSLVLRAEGIVAKDQDGWRFREVVLRPRLTIAHCEDKDRAHRLLRKAEVSCLIGRSIACPIALDSAPIIAEQPILTP